LKVLIDQQFHLGHHYHYIAHLLPALTAVVEDVTVAVTPAGLASDEFRDTLAPFAPAVKFEPILPEATPSLPMGERDRLHRDLRDAVRAVNPDYVLIPSGDAQSTTMAFWRWTGRGALPKAVPCEAGIHFGSGRAAQKLAVRVRDRLNSVNLALSGLTRIHLINLLFYEDVKALGPIGRRFGLMPHPVKVPVRQSKINSRRRLRIPEDGRYIGLAASIDSRKAIAEWLAAFRAASRSPNERLLLAGWINNTHLQTIQRSYADLIEQGRLILLNRFLDQATYQAAISALDVVCTPYPGFRGLSSTLLEGVAAGRPILANACGWSQAIVRRFGLGWTCDVLNPEAFAATIRTALDQCDDYAETPAVSRLLAFHAPENFARTWVQGIRTVRGAAGDAPLTWEWVEESLPADRRRLI